MRIKMVFTVFENILWFKSDLNMKVHRNHEFWQSPQKLVLKSAFFQMKKKIILTLIGTIYDTKMSLKSKFLDIYGLSR